jgi:hypothetical protein
MRTRPNWAAQIQGMETAMTKLKTFAAALAALTVAASLTLASGEAQAHHAHWGPGIGMGFAAGALVGAACRRRRG